MKVDEKFSLSIDRIEFSSTKTLSYNADADTSIDEIKAKAIYIDDETGKENIAVIAPSFSSDCVETLEEICGEISESFIEAGGKNFLYIPCLNDEKIHIDMFFNIIKNELLGWI